MSNKRRRISLEDCTMAVSFDKILASSPFTFLIGPYHKSLIVHASAISSQSPVFNTLINGPMAEAQARQAVLDDVDEETFTLFVQFAYTGDYVPPSCVVTIESPSATENQKLSPTMGGGAYASTDWDAELAEPAMWSYSTLNQNKYWVSVPNPVSAGVPVSQPSPRLLFNSLMYPPTISQSQIAASCAPRGNKAFNEDYTQVFLAHARLYVFAEKYNVKALQALTLNKLHATLALFTLYAEKGETRTGDVVELIKYVYDNTPERTNPIDKMRELVSLFAACEAPAMAKSADFLELLEDGGAFVTDVFKAVVEKRLG